MTRIPSHTIGDAPEITRPLLEEMMQSSPNGWRLGVDWVMPPAAQPRGSRSVIFKDPGGNLVNVFSSCAAPAPSARVGRPG